MDELLGISKSSVFPNDFPDCALRDCFCSFLHEKTAFIRSELDSQPANSTPTPHSFVGSELCCFEPVSQRLVRKLIRDSAPKSSVLDPIVTTLLQTYLDALDLHNCERITVVWVCSFAVQGGSRGPPSEKKLMMLSLALLGRR